MTYISGYPSATGREQDREVRRPKTDVLPACHATNVSAAAMRSHLSWKDAISDDDDAADRRR